MTILLTGFEPFRQWTVNSSGEAVGCLAGRDGLATAVLPVDHEAAMVLALTDPARVNRLVVADIAPVAYRHSHARYLAAMRGLYLPAITRRSEADPLLADAIPEASLRAFILQNLVIEEGRARWKPNLDTLANVIDDLLRFPDDLPPQFDGPALFIHGTASDYVAPETHAAIRQRFPQARIEGIEGAGHWLHAEKPAPFLEAVERFLAEA
jgi:pimeloyl-ACP methyl ester carboxylesterase